MFALLHCNFYTCIVNSAWQLLVIYWMKVYLFCLLSERNCKKKNDNLSDENYLSEVEVANIVVAGGGL